MNKGKKLFQRKLKTIKSYFFNEKKGYAKGLSGAKLFLIFAIFSVFGTYYEQILNLVVHYVEDGSIFWEYRRGVIYGPFSPIYGAGAVLFTLLLNRKDMSYLKTFFYGSLIGGGFEYLISVLQEIFVGTASWDYSGQFLNINGRTSIPLMLVWGLLSVLYSKFLYPILSKWIENAPYYLMKIFTIGLVIFLVFDMAISWTALLRQNFRRKGMEPFTIIGKFYDQVYTDEALKEYFPNMEIKE